MSELKVLSYNILEGLQHSQVQIDVFVEWVTKHDPDITFYQELNGWTEEKFAELARRCGHPYSAKITQDGYRMGISSRYELCDVQRVTEGFLLGYVYAKTLDYHLFAIHLNAHSQPERLREITQILEHAKSLPQDSKIMLAGDFNSLAESDDDAYQDADFVKNLQATQPNFTLEYAVTNALLQAGFTDAYRLHHSEFKRSLPTAKRIYPGDAGRRIDYAFLSPALQDKCTSAEIIHDPITRFLSDHYPLVFKLKV
jgi:exonuclease III